MEETCISETEYDVNASIKDRVFYAARDGLSLTLFALLYGQNKGSKSIERETDDLINQVVVCEGAKCTPLIAAARNGRDAVIKILLEMFKPYVRLETEGTVRFDEYLIEGATALWCAAGAGHLSVVKRLVKAGADVNHATRKNSTPLRAACYDGRLDIVKFLYRHGADIHRTNTFNNTCLMIAAYRGHLPVVQFLLECGAKVDEKAKCGATALHFAADGGHADVICALLDHGAKIVKNDHGMTPLMSAAERARASVVEILVERGGCTREEVITAYELLGGSFANDREYYCLTNAYKYLHMAMVMRHDTKQGVVLKEPFPQIPGYDNWKESETLEELERLRADAHALHMEGLCVRERVLGADYPDLPHSIIYRGAVAADEERFDRSIALWGHALQLSCALKVTIAKDLLRFSQLFSQMIHMEKELPLSKVSYVLEVCSEEIKRCRTRDRKHCDSDMSGDEEYENVRTALYLCVVAANIINRIASSISNEDMFRVRQAIKSLRTVRMKSGHTLLHMAVSYETPVDEFHTITVCRFPCLWTTKLLIECGFDVDALDDCRRTPLLTSLVSYQLYRGEVEDSSLSAVVCELLGAGAHPDVVDKDGISPLVVSIGGPAEQFVRSSIRPHLACIAANSMATKSRYFTPSDVPRNLHKFLELHGIMPLIKPS